MPACQGHILHGRHSVYAAGGETDVLLLLRHEGAQVALMIEDKIGAPLQPLQGERYHERGRDLCATGEADTSKTVLWAPRTYLADVAINAPWQVRLAIEEMASWIADPSPAGAWRRAILSAAASKATRARAADDRSSRTYDAPLVALKEAYRHLVEARFPDLVATKQTGRDREYFLSAHALPSGLRLKHAFFRGEVSLILEKRWTARAAALGASPEGAWAVPHGAELHVRRAVEGLDPALPLGAQEDVAIAALEAACGLGPLGLRHAS